jgi:DNA modification methylase
MATQLQIEMVDISALKFAEYNPRVIDKKEFAGLVKSIETFGLVDPIIINKDNTIIGGHQRTRAASTAGHKQVPCVRLQLNKAAERKLNVILNSQAISGKYDDVKLAEMLEEFKLDPDYFELRFDQLEPLDGSDEEHADMGEQFGVPPFSILDTRKGEWQDKKRAWLALGIESETGRGDDLMIKSSGFMGEAIKKRGGGTSVFDPVLCELMYSWFNIPQGSVLDPFAGGSVRGIVAAKTGHEYAGHELRKEQVEANQQQANELCDDVMPAWVDGDSNITLDDYPADATFDMVFSCPPYADLEVYSDDPSDLSNMPYDKFLLMYGSIIKKACRQLANDRFAVFVVGEVRDKKGHYYNFVGDTIQLFKQAGLHYYNEIILINPAGTLPLRAGRAFNAARKVGKQHQNVLVFYKGDAKKIKTNYPALELPSGGEDEAVEKEEELQA